VLSISKLAEKMWTKKKINRKDIVFNSVFFSGMLLGFPILKLYEMTFIPIEIIVVLFGIAVLGYLLVKNRLKNRTPWIGNLSNFIFCIVVGGNLLTFLLLGINSYFGDRQVMSKTFAIVRKSEIYSRHSRGGLRVVYIDTRQGYNKRFTFGRAAKDKVNESIVLRLSVSSGFFRYDVIRDRKLE